MLRSLIDQQLGRYAIQALLGRGGMAAVYRARDTVLQRNVALKLLYPQYSDDASLVERFKREAVTAASLDHPHIVPIYDVGEQDDMVYFAMKLLHGRSMQDLLAERGTLSLTELLAILEPVSAALDYAHRRGVIHRDVKPGNIFLDSSQSGAPHVMLTDFGIAKVVDSTNTGLTTTGALIGTPDYMAPEQIAARPVDGRVDVYALGMVAFRALTGRRAFEGSTQDVLLGHLYQQVPRPSSINAQLNDAIDAIVLRAVASDPAARYASAGAFVQALRTFDSDQPTLRAQAAIPQRRATQTGAPTVRAPQAATPYAATQARPAAAAVVQANYPAPQPVAYDATVSRAPSWGWFFAAVFALALLAVSAYIVLGRNPSSGSNNGSIPPVSVIESATASPSPSGTAEPTAIASVTAEPTGLIASATPEPAASEAPSATLPPPSAPTIPPTAASATAIPSTAIPPTATVQPSPSPTSAPSDTTEPTATAEPTATTTAVNTPTPCANNVIRGFGTVYRNNPQLAERLGCPTGSEIAGDAVEQYFIGGAMYWWRATDIFYVFYGLDAGSYAIYTGAEVAALPEPPPASAPNDPISGFGRIYYGVPGAREALGASITGEQILSADQAGALQFFERGRMIFTPLYRGEQRKAIFVLYTDRSFQRYNDVFVE